MLRRQWQVEMAVGGDSQEPFEQGSSWTRMRAAHGPGSPTSLLLAACQAQDKELSKKRMGTCLAHELPPSSCIHVARHRDQ